jgi:NAD(P)-dependent dehydrogenase (short-subunit alcohol dehydrogenase family)
MLLAGRRVIVTGAASGIGAATVRACVENGAAVAALDIDDARGRQLVATLAEFSEEVGYFHCDISERGQVDAAFADAVELLGGLDALVNVAGVEQLKPAEEVTEADLAYVFGTNFNGTLFTNTAAFRSLNDHGGSIINYASAAGVEGTPRMPLYSAAKGAVLAFTRSVARDWGRFNIRVNVVCPAIVTPMLQAYLDGLAPEERQRREATLAARFPLGGGPGMPRDAADVNVFLASDLSRFVTGQTIAVDGGMVMMR